METAPEISSALIAQLVRLADHEHEQCGILRGHGQRIQRVDLVANVADEPSIRFEIDPVALIAAHRAARRRGGLDLLGYFHTHPGGDAMPSATDADGAAPDRKLWLIAARGEARLYRAVRAGALHGRFDPVHFDLVVGKRAPERVGGFYQRRSVRMEMIG